jgi:D-alanine-D-alanine ligase
MRVLLAYNEPVLQPTHPEADSEHDILTVVEVMAAQLGRGGFEVEQCGVGRNLDAFRARLLQLRPDIVFNLFEGLGDDPAAECRFARLLENEGVAFTGCSSQTLWTAGRKDLAKTLFQEAALPTPAFCVVTELPLGECRLQWPVIVKPAFRDASVGIEQQNVVTNRTSLQNQVARVAEQYGLPVLIEEFVHGRELSAAVVDWPKLQMLPAVETLFVGSNGDWPIATYDSKWRPESRDYETTPLRYPAELAPDIGDRIAQIAGRAFGILGCRDFATVDFRLSADGKPYLLEVNPNPGLAPSPCLEYSFRLVGIAYSEYLVHLVHAAGARRAPLFPVK